MRRLFALGLIAFVTSSVVLASPGLLLAQKPAAEKPAAEKPAAKQKIPPALKKYKGREIALTMSFHGAAWLIRDNREQEEHCETLLAALELQPGEVVCDMGCGNGYYTLPIAKLVGETGRVLAVDIQPEMLHLLELRAKKEQVENIEPIQSSVVDPKLPEGELDLILLVDVYHEFSHPEQMLAAMRKALKPTGRIALVEFRLEDVNVPIKLEHKMSKEQIMKEFPPNGFKLVGEFEELPWQHVMFFGRDESKEVEQDDRDDGKARNQRSRKRESSNGRPRREKAAN